MTAAAPEPPGLNALCEHLRDECAELDALLGGGADSIWPLRTRFHHWSVWDEIAHLHLFDGLALLAIADRAGFTAERGRLEAQLAAGAQISGIARERFANLPGGALAARWREGWQAQIAALAALEPRSRLPWFGPDMSARSFATARLMETWAHGQDIWDALERPRPPTARLFHIAQLGVLTFGWSFSNRGLQPPGPQPQVQLLGPNGEPWQWGDATSADTIRGSALDFCLVVTQRRHVEDTRLEAQGATAEAWLRLAQCFAGPAASGPPAGSFPR